MKRTLVLLAALLMLSLTACRASVSEDVFWHMDTAITVRLYGDPSSAASALAACDELLAACDRSLSATDTRSPVYAFNASTDGRDVTLPEDVAALVAKALTLSATTNGAFDMTTAPLGALWQDSEQQNALPSDDQLSAALALVGSSHLTLNSQTLTKDSPDVRIDLGGIGKGYAMHRLMTLLAQTDGITGGIVSMGSTVAVMGDKPDGSSWRIALRDPSDAARAVGYVNLTEGQYLSVSGDYERYFTVGGQHFSHILDPKTGYPPTNGLRSVAVICADGATADALSTAFMVMGEQAARELHASGAIDFEAIFVYDDRTSATDDTIWAK